MQEPPLVDLDPALPKPEQEPPLVDIHPALPKPENAAKRLRDRTVCSDHVPQKLRFEVKIAGEDKILEIVTINLLGGMEDGAYASAGTSSPAFGDLKENGYWQSSRWITHAKYINRLISSGSPPDLICVQENCAPAQEVIDAEAKPNQHNFSWSDQNDRKGGHYCTLFNNKNYQLEERKDLIKAPAELDSKVNSFKTAEGSITLYNIHTSFSVPLVEKENHVKKILEKKLQRNLLNDLLGIKASLSEKAQQYLDKNIIDTSKETPNFKADLSRKTIWEALRKNIPQEDFERFKSHFKLQQKEHAKEVIIFCGDWNSNIGPLDHKQRNICTTIEHPRFHSNKIQGALFSDGGFAAYLNESGEYVIKQAKNTSVNPVKGEPFSDEELAPLEPLKLSKVQAEEVQKQKAILCLDSSYNQTKLIEDQTLFDFERETRERLNDPRALVRPTRNINNRPGIGLICPPPIAKKLKEIHAHLFPDHKDLQVHETTEGIDDHPWLVAVPLEQVALLKRMVRAFPIYDLIVNPKSSSELNQKSIQKIKDIQNINWILSVLPSSAPSLLKFFAPNTANLLIKQFEYLVKSDENNPFKDNTDYTLIHHAARYGALHVMKALLASGKQKIDAYAEQGRTPLNLAVFQGQMEMVEFLVNNSADINRTNGAFIKDEAPGYSPAIIPASPSPLTVSLETTLIALKSLLSMPDNQSNQATYKKHLSVLATLLTRQDQIKEIPPGVLTRYREWLDEAKKTDAEAKKTDAEAKKTGASQHPAAIQAINDLTKVTSPLADKVAHQVEDKGSSDYGF